MFEYFCSVGSKDDDPDSELDKRKRKFCSCQRLRLKCYKPNCSEKYEPLSDSKVIITLECNEIEAAFIEFLDCFHKKVCDNPILTKNDLRIYFQILDDIKTNLQTAFALDNIHQMDKPESTLYIIPTKPSTKSTKCTKTTPQTLFISFNPGRTRDPCSSNNCSRQNSDLSLKVYKNEGPMEEVVTKKSTLFNKLFKTSEETEDQLEVPHDLHPMKHLGSHQVVKRDDFCAKYREMLKHMNDPNYLLIINNPDVIKNCLVPSGRTHYDGCVKPGLFDLDNSTDMTPLYTKPTCKTTCKPTTTYKPTTTTCKTTTTTCKPTTTTCKTTTCKTTPPCKLRTTVGFCNNCLNDLKNVKISDHQMLFKAGGDREKVYVVQKCESGICVLGAKRNEPLAKRPDKAPDLVLLNKLNNLMMDINKFQKSGIDINREQPRRNQIVGIVRRPKRQIIRKRGVDDFLD